MNVSNEKKMELLDLDIASIENHLRLFTWRSEQDMYFYAKELFYSNDREYIKYMITISKDLSDLDRFWNRLYEVTEAINRQINELNNSNTGSCHMTQKVANLYSIYTEVKQRLQTVMLTFKQKLERIKSEQDSTNSTNSVDNGSDGENQQSGCFGSDSENFWSDLSSERGLEFCIDDDKSDGCESLINSVESEEYLTNWIKSIVENQKSGCFGSDSEGVASDSEIVRSDLCSERSEFCINDDKSDGYKSLINSVDVDAKVAAEETIVEMPFDNYARYRLMKWIAATLYLIVVILVSLVDWLEPQCSGMQDNYNWSLEFGLRRMNPTERD